MDMGSEIELQLSGSLPVANVQALAAECLTEIPPSYLRQPDELGPFWPSTVAPQIPVIDMSKLGDDSLRKETEMERLHSASKDWGFFQLINHGIPEEVIQDMKIDMEEFFKLSLPEKMAYEQLPNAGLEAVEHRHRVYLEAAEAVEHNKERNAVPLLEKTSLVMISRSCARWSSNRTKRPRPPSSSSACPGMVLRPHNIVRIVPIAAATHTQPHEVIPAMHGSLPRVHYGAWSSLEQSKPRHDASSLRPQQRFSLSLSSQQQKLGSSGCSRSSEPRTSSSDNHGQSKY
ncbi:hypothetical protein MLD38_037693 [Melastoma candidum]|uniref:Uncharacterized protein n=1 Tax=Melastoma candidum TaxID=119954 RepID=A0ACB9LQ74_9MYRT|nr:hypothetical protein MLD38_037693 [Melastoma candidum]